VVERLDAVLVRLGRDLPGARQLPAATERFVDRLAELDAAHAAAIAPAARASARIVAIAGMAGIGKSALAVEAARRLGDGFEGGALYVDLRGGGGRTRPQAELAMRLLRDLGVAAEAIPGGDGAVALPAWSEPCVGVREGVREALAGVRAGGAIEPRKATSVLTH
jgi:hypothetical protein